jgi:hypothetical protein
VGLFIMPKTLTDSDLLKRIDPEGGLKACWQWTSTKTNMGYGVFSRHYKNQLAHRWSYEFHNGIKLSKDFVVRHTCDNPLCCNPMHLLIGTQKENIQDAYDRNRRVHPWKISKEILFKIYSLKEKGLMNKDIAQQLNISRQVVSKYLRFKREVPLDWQENLDGLIRFEK